ncbi:MAG: hypothetical protein EA361_16685 [Bacteroidetes bacterium]|nr:MAG: hypothetical protein EA361_16685 [Bacteroidota bacterium]
MDTRRFNKLSSFNDIKLEKERLRYEMLLAENRLMENFHSIENLFTIPSLFSRITYGFEVAQNVYKRIRDLTERFSSWRKKKKNKKRKSQEGYYEED